MRFVDWDRELQKHYQHEMNHREVVRRVWTCGAWRVTAMPHGVSLFRNDNHYRPDDLVALDAEEGEAGLLLFVFASRCLMYWKAEQMDFLPDSGEVTLEQLRQVA